MFILYDSFFFTKHIADPSNSPITIGDVVYAVKLQNLAEKMKKYANRSDNSKLIKTMFEFKQEAEACLNAKINMDEMLNIVEEKIKKSGIKIPKEDFKKFKKFIKLKKKRVDHKYAYMKDCLAYGIEYNAELEYLDFLQKSKNDPKNPEEEILISARIEVGCSLLVAGVLAEVVGVRLGLPIIQRLGDFLIASGLNYLKDEYVDNLQEGRKK
ncbi:MULTISPECIES: hypothetical protein [Parachlamydia]|jgi:hypothetical protein|uniref:Uncharacterized protein n=3 Tax=Parachlamydia acanthamoebae TaxID=83552 RepID=F8KW99_PARAV|nr:hypothetical protein [Parachlamydia acanthamoebae]CCB85953.1 putative uncharacterized protein [Parachlamydia acanthamoebae UV-7]